MQYFFGSLATSSKRTSQFPPHTFLSSCSLTLSRSVLAKFKTLRNSSLEHNAALHEENHPIRNGGHRTILSRFLKFYYFGWSSREKASYCWVRLHKTHLAITQRWRVERNAYIVTCVFIVTNRRGHIYLFWMISCRVDTPTAKITASATKLSFSHTTSEMQLVSPVTNMSVTFLPFRNLHPWVLRESIQGSKICSLTLPRHHAKSKCFYQT